MEFFLNSNDFFNKIKTPSEIIGISRRIEKTLRNIGSEFITLAAMKLNLSIFTCATA